MLVCSFDSKLSIVVTLLMVRVCVHYMGMKVSSDLNSAFSRRIKGRSFKRACERVAQWLSSL